ncbi:MAG: NeuD/PglB/VioB family sugar acetyltransferase [Crocinitomicaceae bacterium]|nr:NeuD/PglB/VioB family sugar acetyltransferase [Crocinitomicaceae bacterium]
MKSRLAIVGTGEFGEQVLKYSELQNKYDVVGFFDDFFAEKEFQEKPVLGKIEDIESLYGEDYFDTLFIAIGYNHLAFKQGLQNRFNKIPLATIVHPTAIVEPSATLEEGTLICGNSYIGINSIIKKGAVVHLCSFVPHDNTIEECVFISSGVNLGGKTKIGARTFVGLGATVSDSLNVCEDVLIGASALVLKSITEPGKYIGSPARQLRKND